MSQVIDATRNCTSVIGCLKTSGYHTVIRYYSRPEWKRLGQSEAIALGAAGLRIIVVYQNRHNRIADFSRAQGNASGRHALEYARDTILQLRSSAIYFAVDFDASYDQRGIHEWSEGAGVGTYRGAYDGSILPDMDPRR